MKGCLLSFYFPPYIYINTYMHTYIEIAPPLIKYLFRQTRQAAVQRWSLWVTNGHSHSSLAQELLLKPSYPTDTHRSQSGWKMSAPKNAGNLENLLLITFLTSGTLGRVSYCTCAKFSDITCNYLQEQQIILICNLQSTLTHLMNFFFFHFGLEIKKLLTKLSKEKGMEAIGRRKKA